METLELANAPSSTIRICPAPGDDADDIVTWVHETNPHMSYDDALEAHRIYYAYRSEGQSTQVSRQYAGLSQR